MIGIYKITSPTKKIYIGQSVDIEKRFYTYKKMLCRQQIKLYNSFKKYGVDKHIFEIVTICSANELNTFERYYQEVFCCVGLGGLNCNVVSDNDNTGYVSDETKKRMSIANSGDKNGMFGKKQSEKTKNAVSLRAKNNTIWLGRKHSEQSKLKMSETKANRVYEKRIRSNETLLKLKEANCKIILNLETGIYYYGTHDVYGIKPTTLRNKLNGNKKNNTNFRYV